jgi:hypothetical protein
LRRGRLACAVLLDRLRREGVDTVAGQTTTAVGHAEKLMSATLGATLETLDAAELRALTVAALMPPDSVPLRWVRTVVAESIAQAFPVLSLEQTYGAIAFYLANRPAVDAYLAVARDDYGARR